MPGNVPENITDLLLKWGKGDPAAIERLMPLVYDELRRLAVRYLRHERPNHTLQPTALINEAYLRLVDQQKVQWEGRAQFYGLAARVMRNILVDHARNHQAAKRGGQQFRVSLDVDHRAGDAKAPIEFIAVHEALERLDEIDPLKAKIVELRFFGGLSIEEAAEVLHVGHATVERDWKMAKAWLARELK